MWANSFLQRRGQEYLQHRRALTRSSAAVAGRIAIGAVAGKVQMRWHDGADVAAGTLRQIASATSASNAQRQRVAWKCEHRAALEAPSLKPARTQFAMLLCGRRQGKREMGNTR